jgi:predicted nucleic acid-binding protein
MAAEGRSKAIIDTSVLINFLRIDRTDLLAKHPSYRFVVLDFVRHEVKTYYPEQVARLEIALAAGDLLPDDPPESTDPAELATFAAMSNLRMGQGEMAAIAAARARGLALVMDDQRAWKRSAAFSAGIPSESTVSIMVALIKAGIIDIAGADAIKADWKANHRFALRFSSFADVL